MHDENVYPAPLEFRPERYLSKNDPDPRNLGELFFETANTKIYDLTAYGYGRR
jgi:cytochrome P450